MKVHTCRHTRKWPGARRDMSKADGARSSYDVPHGRWACQHATARPHVVAIAVDVQVAFEVGLGCHLGLQRIQHHRIILQSRQRRGQHQREAGATGEYRRQKAAACAGPSPDLQAAPIGIEAPPGSVRLEERPAGRVGNQGCSSLLQRSRRTSSRMRSASCGGSLPSSTSWSSASTRLRPSLDCRYRALQAIARYRCHQ